MSKIYGDKDGKSCPPWSFPSYREDEIQWETCWHVWRIYWAINSLNADTATPVDFTKIVPTKFHLWFRSSQFLIYSLLWIAPFFKENRCIGRCIGSQTDVSLNAASSNHSKTLYTTHNTEPRLHGNTIARNYFKNWRSHERLIDGCMYWTRNPSGTYQNLPELPGTYSEPPGTPRNLPGTLTESQNNKIQIKLIKK